MIEEVLQQYDLKGNLENVTINKAGNIHNTYLITIKNRKKVTKYIMQKINTVAFKKPKELMSNILNITCFLEKAIKEDNVCTMKLIMSKDNLPYVVIKNGREKEYYRVYEYIKDTVSFDYTKDLNVIYEVAKGFGNFQKYLNDYPTHNLYETIKDFHNTKKRYDNLWHDYNNSVSDRKKVVKKEMKFIKERENICSLISNKLEKSIPLRVTHNDTKVNNILLDKDTLKFKSVIDLDTVMPGSLLFDYGDGVRSTASNTLEDEKDLSKVSLNLELFKAYTDGYLSEVAPYIKEDELLLMGESIRIITLELAIRFLSDYLNGDVYFKIDYPTHNLDRARCQLALVKDIETKLDTINEYISQSYEKYVKID